MNLKPIDTLRGLSILFVLLYHWGQEYGAQSWPIVHGALPIWLDRILFGSGYFGVRIFFVISGFLITWTTIQRFKSLRNIRLGKFYTTRFARIAPPLIALVAVLSYLALRSLPYMGTGTPSGSVLEAASHALTFRINVLLADVVGMSPQWAVLWSLSIEGVFYLLFPLLCIVLPRLALVCFLVGICVVCPFHRDMHLNDASSYHVLFDYLSCFDGIATGVLCALLANKLAKNEILKRFALPVFLAGFLLLFVVLGSREDMVWSPTYIQIAAAIALLPTPLLLTWTRLDAPIRWLGILSYEFYMTHYIVFAFMRGFYEGHKEQLSGHIMLWAAVFTLGAIVAALILYFAVSLPFRKGIISAAKAIERRMDASSGLSGTENRTVS